MALEAPRSCLVLPTRVGGTTYITIDGTGFDDTTLVEVKDLNTANPYQFSADVVRTPALSTATRLLVLVTCVGPLPDQRSSVTKIKVKATTGTATPSIITDFPVALASRRQVVIDHGRLQTQKLTLDTTKLSAMFLPVTGLAEVGELIPKERGEITSKPKKGLWEITKIRQLRRRVKVTLKCTSLAALTTTTPTSSDICITLTSDENEIVETPPVEVEYVNDPEEQPDP